MYEKQNREQITEQENVERQALQAAEALVH